MKRLIRAQPAIDEVIPAAAGQGIVAATVQLGAEVRVPSSKVLLSNLAPFELSATGRPSSSYDVSPDGERLLLILGAGTGVTLGSAEETVLVLNVFEELRQRTGRNDQQLFSLDEICNRVKQRLIEPVRPR